MTIYKFLNVFAVNTHVHIDEAFYNEETNEIEHEFLDGTSGYLVSLYNRDFYVRSFLDCSSFVAEFVEGVLCISII